MDATFLKNEKKCPWKDEKTALKIFFQHCQPAQNQLKSNFLFHINVSLRDFYIMTLQAIYNNIDFGEFNEILLGTK